MRKVLAALFLAALTSDAGWDASVFPPYDHYRGYARTETVYAANAAFVVTNYTSLTNYTISTNSRLALISSIPGQATGTSKVVANYRTGQLVETCYWSEAVLDFVCETNVERVVVGLTNYYRRTPTNLVLDIPDLRGHMLYQAWTTRLHEIVIWTNRDTTLWMNFTSYLGRAETQPLSGEYFWQEGGDFGPLYHAPDGWPLAAYFRSERANVAHAIGSAAVLGQFYFCHMGQGNKSFWTSSSTPGDTWKYSPHRTAGPAASTNSFYPRFFQPDNNGPVKRSAYWSSNLNSVLPGRGIFMQSEFKGTGLVAAIETLQGQYPFTQAENQSPSLLDYIYLLSTNSSHFAYRALNQPHTNMLSWNTAHAIMDSMAIYGKVPCVEVYTDCGPLWSLGQGSSALGRDPVSKKMSNLLDRVFIPMDTWLSSKEVEYTSPGEPIYDIFGDVIGYGETPVSDSIVFDTGRAAMATNLNTVFGGPYVGYDTFNQGLAGNWYTSIGPWESNTTNWVNIKLDSAVIPALVGGAFDHYTTNTMGTYSGWAEFHNCTINDSRIVRQEHGRFLSMFHSGNRVFWTVQLEAPVKTDNVAVVYFGSDGGICELAVELDFRQAFKSRNNIVGEPYQYPIGTWYLKDW